MDERFENAQKTNENTYELELKQVRPEQAVSDSASGTYETLETVNPNIINYTALAQHSMNHGGAENDDHDVHLLAARKSSPKKRCVGIVVAAIVAVAVATIAVLLFLVLSSRDKGQDDVQNAASSSSNGKQCMNYTAEVPKGKIVDITGSNHGDTFKIQCHSGNKLVGHEVVTCLSSSQWSKSPRCEPLQCGDFVTPEHATLIHRNLSRNTGAEILIICNEGFFVHGEKIVVCQKNETWSKIPKCEPVNCGYPENVTHGAFHGMKETKYNSSFSIVCKSGYELIGSSTVICKTNGRWSDLPVCKLVSCGIPSIPKNGHITFLGGTTFGSKAAISCNEHFFINGNPEIHCKENGNWTQSPKCDRNVADCGTPLNVENGRIIGSKTTQFSVSCHQGYIAIGNKTVMCSADGTWSTIPTCRPVSCGIPGTPSNGYIQSSNGTTFMASALIRCEKGYTLGGQAKIKCTSNGEWSQIPSCELKDCGIPRKIANGEIKGLNDTTYNSSFLVQCENSYMLLGLKTVICDSDGNWTELPSCIAQTDCGAPPNISNGSIKGLTNSSYDSALSVSCNEGYTLNGTGFIQCDTNGQWKNIPTCTRIEIPCGLPDIPVNGEIESIKGTTSNKTATMRCKPGFIMIGIKTVRCVFDGKWTEGPICKPDCGVPPSVESGRLVKTDSSQKYSVNCNNGYVLTGEESISCSDNGHWTDHPSCKPVSCGIPNISPNQMLLSINGTEFNAFAHMKCADGFTVNGNAVIWCLSNGSWTQIPECNRIDCGTPSLLHGSTVGVKNTSYGSVLFVACNAGYLLNGPDSIQCGKDGNWSQTPTCQFVQCGLPDIPVNGSIGSIQGTTLNKTAFIICNSGFVLNGTNTIFCLSHGKWSEGPTCVPDCNALPNVENGVMQEVGSTGTTTTFSVNCNIGYVLNGDIIVKCDKYGTWTEVPTCEIVTCGIPEIQNNRKLLTINGTKLNDVAHTKCDEGYILAGNSVITCLSNGSWTWIAPCEEIDCGTPNISHASITNYTDARYQSTFTVTCDDDYLLIGFSTAQCGIDGKWKSPMCKLFPCGLPDIPANGAIDKINGTAGRKTASIVCHPGFLMNGPNVVNCFSHGKWTKGPTCIPANDCVDVYQESNTSVSGIYNVTLWKSGTKLQVYCDMDIDGGRWTVFQHRYEGTVDFYRNFTEYVNGFGSLTGDFWLGLKYIREMTLQGKTELRIDLTAADGSTAYDKFQEFSLGQMYGTSYTLLIGSRSGNAGNSLWHHRHIPFSTYDRDQDYSRNIKCAVTCHGGWWYKDCAHANLNGEYLTPGTNITRGSQPNGMVYLSFKSDQSLKTSKMMFRRV